MALKKIAVIYNIVEEKSDAAEADTVVSAQWVKEVLDKLGYETELWGIGKNEVRKVAEITSDLIFNLIEWTGKETDYALAAIKIMDDRKIPYTGSDIFGYKLVNDKIDMKKKLVEEKIPTPVYQIFETGEEKIEALPYPVIVKPAKEHCGVGLDQMSVAENDEELKKLVSVKIRQFRQLVLAEQFIEGREFHVSILEKNGRPWVLPAAEVVFENHPGYRHVLTYVGKWVDKEEEYKYTSMRVAEISPEVKEMINSIATTAYIHLGGRDYPRLDMRYDGKNLWVLEINNNPGIDYDNDSGIGVSARAAKLTAPQLIDHIVRNCWWRFNNLKNK